MYEIELKAHVHNREQTKSRLDSFALYTGGAEKSDTYWYNADLPPASQTVRVRTERKTAVDGVTKETIFVTIKRKEIRNVVEVNDEIEFTVSSKHEFEKYLQDAGYSIARKKQKSVESWQYEGVLLELCSIMQLGNFLEIEILSESNDVKTSHECQEIMYALLERCDINKDAIETAYYSELLERLNK